MFCLGLELGGFWSGPEDWLARCGSRAHSSDRVALLRRAMVLRIEPTAVLPEQMKRVPTLKLAAKTFLKAFLPVGGGRMRSWVEIDEDGTQAFRDHS